MSAPRAFARALAAEDEGLLLLSGFGAQLLALQLSPQGLGSRALSHGAPLPDCPVKLCAPPAMSAQSCRVCSKLQCQISCCCCVRLGQQLAVQNRMWTFSVAWQPKLTWCHVSAGQMQLLALARVLLRQPDLVLLDECDAALDASSAAAVRDMLARQLPGSAILQVCLACCPVAVDSQLGCAAQAGVSNHRRHWQSLGHECSPDARGCMQVAHRLDHILACQTAVVMQQGTIAEQGPPAQLAADTGSLLHSMLQAGRTERSSGAA